MVKLETLHTAPFHSIIGRQETRVVPIWGTMDCTMAVPTTVVVDGEDVLGTVEREIHPQ